MGGRLQQYAGRWTTISPAKWVLGVVTLGYSIEFTSPPPTHCLVRPTVLPQSMEQREALLNEVSELLAKGAIYPVFPPFREGFWSTFFLAPKKTGDWRPILNLKPLNQFIKPRRFRMESLASVLQCPIKDMWAASIDLKDAYLHVPIAPAHQRWLTFQVEGQSYRFRCLPFGLSTAPRVFTRVAKAVAAYLRRRGVNLCVYLDDWLIYARSCQETARAIALVVQVVQDLGFLVNVKKSNLNPSQCPQFLGAQLDLNRGLATPTQERVSNTVACVKLLVLRDTAPAVAWLKVLGLMASLVDLVPFCRFHMRAIQIHFLAHFKPSRDPISKQVPLNQFVRDQLRWWAVPANLSKGMVFPSPPVTLVVTTDASTRGWGGHLDDHRASGVWTSREARSHINLLELWAVQRSVAAFEEIVTGHKILIQSDSSTVVAYLNKQGGTRSSLLCAHTLKFLTWCREREIAVTAAHIAGVTNVLADDLSRGLKTAPTECSLAPHIVQTVFDRMFYPSVDLFATVCNKQLPVYCTRFSDPGAYAVDALSVSWSGLAAYAFPPISLLNRVVQKIARDECEIILIAPFWPQHLWFRPMVDLLRGRPLLLPQVPDLLRRPGDLAPKLTIEALKLTAWPLSGIAASRQAFLKDLPNLSREVGGTQRSEFTLSVWVPTTSGAKREIFLPLGHL